MCSSDLSPRAVEQVAAVANRTARAAPRFGASTVWLGLPCTFWPVAPTATVLRGSVPVGPHVLVIGTTGDPATPYAWARALTARLGDARLLTVTGTSHTAYPGGDECVRRLVDDYVDDLTVPAAGARCPTGQR